MKNKKLKLIEEANKRLLNEDYGGNQFELPPNHLAAIKVPKGGSSCANCLFWNNLSAVCNNEYYKKWNGDNKIPFNPDEYCSDWWEPKN